MITQIIRKSIKRTTSISIPNHINNWNICRKDTKNKSITSETEKNKFEES